MNGRAQNLLGMLRHRAAMLARIREFFAERDVLEVDTPALSSAAATDPNIASVRAEVAALEPAAQYLHTSPELAMKRLVALVGRDVYQICRVFRDGELGRWHQPEFLMLEWYRVGFDEHALMDEVGDLLEHALARERSGLERRRSTYARAFRDALGIDPHPTEPSARQSLQRALADRGIEVPAALDDDAVLDLALGTLIVPGFDPNVATFVHDYPASQAALAEIDTTSPTVCARFEVFLGGVELANGFRELTNAREQRRRFQADLARRRRAGLPTAPVDEEFLTALERGLPACAGVALGIDRLVAVGLGVERLADALPLPH